MKKFDNIINLIIYLENFMIPYEYFDICWFIKLENNEKYRIITPKIVFKNLQLLFKKNNKLYNQNYYLKLENFINFIKKNNLFKFLRCGKILYYSKEISKNMIQCNNCGSIFKNYSKCKCYLYQSNFGEFECSMY